MERTIRTVVRGTPAVDGAGVRLTRVLGSGTAETFDPFLMLDSFDSENPADYIAGFPMHPHRGIETITFLSEGAMTHRDSMGNEDTVTDGEVQWMTAGSGIMHEEKLPACKRMLGVQLWLNLPATDKMVSPDYHALKRGDIPEVALPGGSLRVLAGRYKDTAGFQGPCLKLTYYDIRLKKGGRLTFASRAGDTAFVFTLLGGASVGGEALKEKSAALLSDGDSVTVSAADGDIELLYLAAPALGEPIAWGGPIVMASEKDLRHAFAELRDGTFLKESVHYSA